MAAAAPVLAPKRSDGTTSASAPERRADSSTAFIDRIRVGLTALVIVHHTALSFGSEGAWYYRPPGVAPGSSLPLTALCAVDQAFFMGFFFLLAGYFTPGSLARKGPRRFLGDRFVRLGIPLVVYAGLLSPLTRALASGAPLRDLAATTWAVHRDGPIDIGPLWFVEALLLFALAFVGWRALGGPASEGAGARLPRHRTLAVAGVATGLVAFAIRLVVPVGQVVGGLQLGYFASYVVLFAAGCAAASPRWLEQVDEAYARPWGRVAWLTGPTLFVYAVLAGPSFSPTGGWTGPALAYALWEPFVAWGIILSILARARTAAHPGRWWGRLTPRAYTSYVIHPPIVVAWTRAVVAAGIPYTAGFFLVAAASVATTFAVAGLVIRIPGARRVL
jgi:peptidoglycan/LPS O-acetylase OafA/YrhL